MLIHWSKSVFCSLSYFIYQIMNFDFRVDPTLCTSAAAKAAELAQQNDSSCSIQVNLNLECN